MSENEEKVGNIANEDLKEINKPVQRCYTG